MRAFRLAAAMLGPMAFLAPIALAQDTKPEAAAAAQPAPAPWPSQTVRIVTAVAAGSQSDILARAMTEHLARKWGKEVIVENRPGIAGTASVAKGTPDGHTLLLASNGHAMIPAQNRNLNFDSVKDFAGVTRIATLPGILVVPPEIGPKTLQQLILNAKANPGRYNYASSGLGSTSSIALELLKADAGINLVHVPFKGLPDAHVATMRGDTLVTMTFYSAGGELISGGKLRAIAIAGPKRMPALPDVPTVAEAGVPKYQYEAWFGYLVQAGTPREIIAKVNADLAEVARMPAIQERFTKLGVDVATSTPEAMDALLKSDTDRFTALFAKPEEKK